MANGHGGYRRPNKPAAVSGPGKFSKRTDGGPDQPQRYLRGDGSYGDSKELNEIASGAPLAKAPTPPVIPLDAPPTMPVTSGLPWGDGPGREALPTGPAPEPETPDIAAQVIRSAAAAFPSPALRRLVDQLEAEGR